MLQRMTGLALATLICAAAPAMALDMTRPIVPLTGKTFAGPDGKPATLTLGTVAADALLMPFPDEKGLDAKQKVERYELAKRIVEDPAHVTLTVEETALIKKLIGNAYSAGVVGPAFEMLDPASVGEQ